MRIWASSDLHLPHRAVDLGLVLGGVPDADVCVVPGDLLEGWADEAVRWLDEQIAPHMPCLLVLGNHEFYNWGRDMETNRAQAQAASWKTEGRVTVLDDMCTTIDGVRFCGTTLWTDFELNGTDDTAIAHSMQSVRYSMSDYRFRAGRDSSHKWTPELSRRQHRVSKAWLEQELAASDLPTVVVSHHAPAPGSIAPEYEMDMGTAAFVSDLTDVIEKYQPSLWVHGHVHSSFDYMVGGTRVVANPKGHGRENARRFDPALVIEVDGYRPRPPGF